MKIIRQFVAALVAACIAWAPVQSAAHLHSAGTNQAAVSITGGNVPRVISHVGIPLISVPSGTMANNGAVTFGTALAATYSNGFWGIYPAGAVAAGVPAAEAILWTVMSSSTVGIVYNSTYSGNPAPGAQTAFATTGPGAFTGTLTENGYLLPIAANTLGPNGVWRLKAKTLNNNSAGAKTFRVRYSGLAGTVLGAPSLTTGTDLVIEAQSVNSNGTGAQEAYIVTSLASSMAIAGARLAIDTTAATTVAVTIQKGTATDYAMFTGLVFEQINDGT